MRIVLFRVTLAFSLLTPLFCPAQLLWFRGAMRSDHLGDGGQAKQSYRAWILLDRASGTMAKLNYFSAAGFKLYTIEQYEGMQLTTVAGARGVTNSLLTKAETRLDPSNQLSVTSLFLQGANRRLTLKRGETLAFPSTLNWVYRGVAPSTRTAQSATRSETGVVAYAGADTVTSNNRSETLAQALDRLMAEFQTKGYREFLLR